jgi:hypothetical protein
MSHPAPRKQTCSAYHSGWPKRVRYEHGLPKVGSGWRDADRRQAETVQEDETARAVMGLRSGRIHSWVLASFAASATNTRLANRLSARWVRVDRSSSFPPTPEESAIRLNTTRLAAMKLIPSTAI